MGIHQGFHLPTLGQSHAGFLSLYIIVHACRIALDPQVTFLSAAKQVKADKLRASRPWGSRGHPRPESTANLHPFVGLTRQRGHDSYIPHINTLTCASTLFSQQVAIFDRKLKKHHHPNRPICANLSVRKRYCRLLPAERMRTLSNLPQHTTRSDPGSRRIVLGRS